MPCAATPCFAAASLGPSLVGLVAIVAAIAAIAYQVDVRLALFLTALTLGALSGQPNLILDKFFETFTNEKFVVPICTAMGFAYALKHTGCDQHLVRLLVKPLLKARFLLFPGTIVIGFLVNMPIVSQTSTAVTIGTVVIPVLRAARVAPATIGAALLLGSSIGGELFNPGAPELRTTVNASQEQAKALGLPHEDYNTNRCVERILPLNVIGLVVAILIFSWRARGDLGPPDENGESHIGAPALELMSVNYFKAMVPLAPIVLLYLTAPPFNVIEVPMHWLLLGEDTPARRGLFASRLIGAVMLLGVAIAAAASRRQVGGVAKAFFDGAGYGFANIVSLIVIAACFGEGIVAMGWAGALGEAIRGQTSLLIGAAGTLALGFATLCGSGMAATQALFPIFARPALESGLDPIHVGAVVSLASAAGRTLSPVAAVTLMCAQLTGACPFTLMRRVAPPLLASTAAIIIVGAILAPGR